jgi:putative thioredoxin
MAGAVIDSTDATFMVDVIEASRRGPVVVDFWAEWCGPCKMLGPILERVAAESPEVTLVKLNTDENPQVAQAFQIQSIPAVKAFFNGEVVDEFLGAQSEPEVRRFFARLTPSEADLLAEQGNMLLGTGDLENARARFEAALETDPQHGGAAAGLLAILLDLGELDAAEALAARFEGDPEVTRVAGLVRFVRGAAGHDPDALIARLEANEDDVEARYAFGCLLASSAQWEQALECFLDVVKIDRAYGQDAGRLAMLDIFALLSNDHPLTNEYRSRLTMVLF